MGVTAGFKDPWVGVSSAKRLMETILTSSLPVCLHTGLGPAAVQPLALAGDWAFPCARSTLSLPVP